VAPRKPLSRFKTTRLIGEYEKPWLKEKDPRVKYDKIFFFGFAIIGCCIAAYICWSGWTSIGSQKVILINLPKNLLMAND
jgi:hypothetical protein